MARVNSLLTILVDQRAHILELSCGRAPRLLRDGRPLSFHLPELDEQTLRSLLGPLLTAERQAQIGHGGKCEFHYEMERGQFQVELAGHGTGSTAFDAVFRLSSAADASASAPPLAPSVNEQLDAAGLSGAATSANGTLVSDIAPQPAAIPDALLPILRQAVERGASDLHLGDGQAVVLRVAGGLQRLGLLPDRVLDSWATQLSGQAEWGGHSLDSAFSVAGVGRLRLNLYRAQGRAHAAIRILPQSIPALAALDLPRPVSELPRFSDGLVLICGASGSGKSTTMAALALRCLQGAPQVAITIEDPVEYLFELADHRSVVRQRAVGRDVASFEQGLRDALREDPDLILVGEMRDAETIALALTAAETGHLVLATLHSRSAVSAIERICDSYPAERQQQIRVQLADALRAVVAQRLLPHQTEARRVPVAEVLRVTGNVAALIREGKTAQLATAIQSGRNEGMLPFDRCLAERVAAAALGRQTALAAAHSQDALLQYLQHGQRR